MAIMEYLKGMAIALDNSPRIINALALSFLELTTMRTE